MKNSWYSFPTEKNSWYSFPLKVGIPSPQVGIPSPKSWYSFPFFKCLIASMCCYSVGYTAIKLPYNNQLIITIFYQMNLDFRK